jgi:hypothetical protein
MEESLAISKNRKLPASQDFEFLRKEGLKHIENLSHAIWTDYNTHDPGITILEALCYAITELGYRSSFEMKDLLTKADGNIVPGQVFFTARQILTINPLTKNDYRKLLVDIEGIHNAWLLSEDFVLVNGNNKPVNEVPIYADCKNDELDYEQTAIPLFLSGLYRVLIDLDFHELFGDLNNGEVIAENPALPGRFIEGEFLFSIVLPSWKSADFTFAELAQNENNIDTASITKENNHWSCELKLLTVVPSQVFKILVSKKPASGKVEDADVRAMLGIKSFLASVFKMYLMKILAAKKIVQVATKKLHEHRNLCEDFVSITTIDDEQIAFCFDVDVKPGADIERVQAEIFYAIENYLNPPIHFYSLSELIAKKIPADEIFSGPVLSHGFIDSLQLEKTELRKVIYTSDIINLLMEIEGVISVRNFVMTKYGSDGLSVPSFKGLKWCMDITDLHKPVLSIDKSKILLFKDEFPFTARYDEVKDTITLLHAERSRNKLNGIQDDIPLPAGSKRDTESYWPVQYDFPQTYGIGEAGLPSTASQLRIAQQRQLKAYLMFYEQLLADHFSQLSNAHRLFSIDPVRQSYHAQFLDSIKDIDPIYKSNLAGPLLKKVIGNADSLAEPENDWQRLYEPRDLFEDRRNRFLDHLLARFAESFNEYALLMYKLNYEERSEEKISFTELTEAKTRTLENYDEISANRGKAFNYFPQTDQFRLDVTKFWDSDNVSGLEKRIGFLTGIKDITRRFLYCIQQVKTVCIEEEVIDKAGNKTIRCYHRFSFISLTGIKMISKKYENKTDAELAVVKAIESGANADNYTITSGPPYHIVLQDILSGVDEFNSQEEASDAIKQISAEFAGKCNDPIGLHLIEHILLRPRTADFRLMEVCLHGCECPCKLDPYSFRASVVLPYWPGHFDSMAFREYFEKKIREEAPAQVMLKICWLNNELMREFEVRYKEWIERLAGFAFEKATIDEFVSSNDKMIEILAQLYSEYPAATLHNCEESKEGSNTVVLGKTVLGTFKN